ncbi:MAG TPA: hypothetical protein VJT32_10705 [bacterium]|nr:hypothetical protein [bacterium]
MAAAIAIWWFQVLWMWRTPRAAFAQTAMQRGVEYQVCTYPRSPDGLNSPSQ